MYHHYYHNTVKEKKAFYVGVASNNYGIRFAPDI